MGQITGNGTAVTGLGGAAGYGEVMLPRGDDAVAQVDVSAVFEGGFTLGGAQFGANQLYISTDGLISFGAAVSGVAAGADTIAAPFMAIFHADVDTRLDGEGAESGAVWLDIDAVNDCVTITWADVGFYRRNATLTNTFQIQLFDRGNGGFDVVYRYQNISWTSGDLQGGWGGLDGVAALIGQRAGASGLASLMAASGDGAAQLALDTSLGNTGVAGLWVHSYTVPSVITGTEAADVLNGTSANDTQRGLAGDDRLMGSAGADVLDGGSGQDMADYGTATGPILIDLLAPGTNTGQAAGDSYLSVEGWVGSSLGDTLWGGTTDDLFYGSAGADTLGGRAGADSLSGGAGSDRMTGHGGNDLLDAGGDNDRLFGNGGADVLLGGTGDDVLAGGGGADSLTGGDGSDLLLGGSGNDTLTGGTLANDGADTLRGGQGRDALRGGAFDDALRGDGGSDTLHGDDGDDQLNGSAGRDVIWGDAGSDQINGGAGPDRLDGGLSQDTLTGGAGADTFVHAGTGGQDSDWIRDFAAAEGDRLLFGIAGATRADFSVTYDRLDAAGRPGVAEALITYLPTGRLVWILVDGADETSILLQSSMNSFDLL